MDGWALSASGDIAHDPATGRYAIKVGKRYPRWYEAEPTDGFPVGTPPDDVTLRIVIPTREAVRCG